MPHAANALLLVCLWAVAPAAPPADAPPPATSLDGVNTNLEKLNASATDLLALLRRAIQQEDLALVMKRVEIDTFLLVETTRRINDVKQERETLADSVLSSEETVKNVMGKLSNDRADATPDERKEQDEMVAQMEQGMARERDRLKKLDLQVTELENQAATQRDEIDHWQELVDRYFERPKTSP